MCRVCRCLPVLLLGFRRAVALCILPLWASRKALTEDGGDTRQVSKNTTETSNPRTTETSNPRKPKQVKGFRNPEASKEGISRLTKKYWRQRYRLFSKYDQGIKMDEEGWFSVTPEEIAIRHAGRCTGHEVVIDAFSGVGGNAIQFARKGCHVIAIDIDPAKVALAMNNAKVYGVEEYIDFIVGDFFALAPSLKGDIVFLSPPWGGPSYKDVQTFTLELLKPVDGYTLFKVAQAITPNIIMFLPRNINLEQVAELCRLSSPPLELEVELNHVQNYLKGVTLYFGSTVAAPPRFSIRM
ncbi:trimethylguanosine synthase-like [Neltuma alba]|uniref:trimethylguanosine synthase-like n=1 Tax=Neltuma alba TaxID=207710 RepID=UPI0010A379A7|nr:trimethylguanosine synthase-like [Prosopis alba]